MNSNKIPQRIKKINSNGIRDFDHYLALDWSLTVMAVAHMNQKYGAPKIHERPSNIKELKEYLMSLKGRKILILEETTTSQWLYLELVDIVDRILSCDPFRNRLLSDGPQTIYAACLTVCATCVGAGTAKPSNWKNDKV